MFGVSKFFFGGGDSFFIQQGGIKFDDKYLLCHKRFLFQINAFVELSITLKSQTF